MYYKFKLFVLLGVLFLSMSCKGQKHDNNLTTPTYAKIVGGPFENAEYMYYGMPDFINSVDTSEGWYQKGQKLLITGTIYKKDGRTPAPDVVLYYYHTDIQGYYSDRDGLDRRARRHGYIRGWVKSDDMGKYAIYTVRPSSYPHTDIPAHIHPAIKEPNIEKEYYLDDLVFDDDVLLTGDKRKSMQSRGGSGVLRILQKGDLQIAEHNIILGLNIPNYPKSISNKLISGKDIGEDVLSFTPYHAWGPDKGKKVCPVCKYGRYHGILYFVGNSPDWTKVKDWLVYFESESAMRNKYLKVYFILGDNLDYSENKRNTKLEKLGNELSLKHVALTFVSSFDDIQSSVHLNRINPSADNTIIIYRQANIIDKYINLRPTPSNFRLISDRLTETTSEYFNLDAISTTNTR